MTSPFKLSAAALALFAGALLAARIGLPEYAHRLHPVGLRGAIGMPWATAFNLAAFVVPGVLLAWAGLRLRAALAMRGWLARVGVVLVQLDARSKRSATDEVQANLGKLEGSLDRIVEKAARLDTAKESLDVYEVRHKIDDMFMEDLDIFVQARESIGHAHGLQAYADVMSHFATGERYLNRSWSASTDGYIDEVHKYISRAREQFQQALELLRALQLGAASKSTGRPA